MRARGHIVRFGGIGVITLVLVTGLGPSADAQERRHKTYFVGKDGVPVLTNRPHAYRTSDDYEEIKINFQPVVVTGRYNFTPGRADTASADLAALVRYWSGIYNLDPNLIFAIIRAESNFDPYAVSEAGARGLMQLMPGTAAEMRVTNVFDPEQNVAGGTQYLAKLFELFDDNVELSLAAYNAGPGAVRKHGGIPPYRETQEYVRKVTRYTREYARGKGDIHLAMRDEAKPEEFLPMETGRFTIHYKSGATQPADRIEEQDLFYNAEYNGRKYLIRKKFVDRIVREN
jgi:hypothetical protein